MDWAEHNLIKTGDIVSLAAWKDFGWLRQGFSLRSAGNIDYRFGDATAAQQAIRQTLGCDQAQWTGMQQVHGSRIQIVDAGSDFPETDGMITDKPNILLTVVVADCVPILVVDPVRRIVGVAHAGRKGTEAEIAKMIVNELVNNESNAQDLQVALGPSIGPCCYETDLWASNEQQLREAGVITIIRTDICTKDHNDSFFSHRGDKVEGRFAGLIGIV